MFYDGGANSNYFEGRVNMNFVDEKGKGGRKERRREVREEGGSRRGKRQQQRRRGRRRGELCQGGEGARGRG